MERHELERMLRDPKIQNWLGRSAKEFREQFGDIGNGPASAASRVKAVESRAYDRRPTADEAKSNDSNFTVRSGANLTVARYLSAERGSDLETDLRLARKACSDRPSDANRLFLEIAINQVISSRALDEQGEKAIEDAIYVLTYADRPERAKAD